ncbi:MAG: DUF1552 domain-containing protein [Myxococcota bacterium]
MPRSMSRRQVLRGAAGFTLALPLLPSLLPRDAGAGGGPLGPRRRRFISLCTEHGGIWGDNMWPGDAMLSDDQTYAGHSIRRGDLVASEADGRTRLSQILSAPSTLFTPEILGKLNLIRGLDHTFYIAHHQGGHLGNYAQNDGNGTDGQELHASHRPTIDQLMAWSQEFYPDLATILERSLIMGNNVSFGWSSPATQSGTVQAMPAEWSSLALFNRIFVPEDDLVDPRPPVVDRVIDNYLSLRQSNRRLSSADRQRLDDHLERLDELQRRLEVSVSCGDVPVPRTDTYEIQGESSFFFDPEAQARYWQLFNDVIVAAMLCDTSRIAVMRVTNNFSSFPGDWHQDVAHQAHLPNGEAQALLAEGNQRFFENVFMDLVSKLDVPQGDGTTLLDDCLVAWSQESGNQTHESISTPVITAGSGGGNMRTGQYVDYRNLAKGAFGKWDESNETLYPGLTFNQWLGTALQTMGMSPKSYESGDYGGYGEHFVGEGREHMYAPGVLDAQGDWLPWLQA